MTGLKNNKNINLYMDNNNISIFILTHKNFNTRIIPKNGIYTIVDQKYHQFNLTNIDYISLKDDKFTTKNNVLYSELCQIKYLYDHPELLKDVVGIFHYRRMFNNVLHNESNIMNILNDYKCIAVKNAFYASELNFVRSHKSCITLIKDIFHIKTLNAIKDIIYTYYSEYITAYNNMLNDCVWYNYNMSIMSKQDFLNMYEFCFDILDKFNTYNIDINNEGMIHWTKSRLYAYIGEWLTNLYILKNFKNQIYELPLAYLPYELIRCRTCVVSIQKSNDRLQEWIDHHLSLGFDHIYIADNNQYENRIIINNPKVTVIPFNDISIYWKSFYMLQVMLTNTVNLIINTYSQPNLKEYYDYIYICSGDDYLELYHHKNISDLINDYNERYNKTINNQFIFKRLNFSDNNIIYLKDESKDKLYNIYNKQSISNPFAGRRQIFCNYPLVDKYIVNGNGIIKDNIDNMTNKLINEMPSIDIDPSDAIIRHYPTRCLEWYLKVKVKELYFSIKTDWFCTDPLEGYAIYNEITKEKLDAFLELYKKYFGKPYNNDKILDKYKKLCNYDNLYNSSNQE